MKTLKDLFMEKKRDVIELDIDRKNYHLFIQGLDEGCDLCGKFDLERMNSFCVEVIQNKYDVVDNIYNITLETPVDDIITEAQRIVTKENNLLYYIEIWHNDIEFEKPYVLQSQWFKTQEEALNWAKTIDYLDSSFTKSLMRGLYHYDTETLGDIDLVENL